MARQAHAKGFGQAVHGIGREHARTTAAAGAGYLLQVPELRLRHLPADDLAHGLKYGTHINLTEPPIGGQISRQHRAATDENGR